MNKVLDIIRSLPAIVEQPHFDKTAFKVRGKIMATYDSNNKRLCIKLSKIEQDLYCRANPNAIYAVPNKWGRQGWTLFEDDPKNRKLIKDAFIGAYNRIAPKPK